jgi:hypothetical protein
VIDALGVFRTQLTEAAEAEARDVERTVSILRSDEIQALTRRVSDVKREVARVGQAAKERGDNAEGARELAKKGLDVLAHDLEELAKSLR